MGFIHVHVSSAMSLLFFLMGAGGPTWIETFWGPFSMGCYSMDTFFFFFSFFAS